MRGVMIGHEMRMTRTGAGIGRWDQMDTCRETSDTGPRVEKARRSRTRAGGNEMSETACSVRGYVQFLHLCLVKLDWRDPAGGIIARCCSDRVAQWALQAFPDGRSCS